MSEQRNPDLYTGAAPYYVVGRAAYPSELADRIAAELALDGTGRLLDVGCGPGSLTLLLADRLARVAGVDHVEWRQLYAEDLPADLGTFSAGHLRPVHPLDGPASGGAGGARHAPAGRCFRPRARHHPSRDRDRRRAAAAAPPYAVLDELSRRYVGPPPPRAGGAGRSGESDVYRAAGFGGPTSITVARPVVTRTAEEIIAAHLSVSSSTPHLFGDQLDAFVTEARALLDAASPAGEFSEQLREVAADIWWR